MLEFQPQSLTAISPTLGLDDALHRLVELSPMLTGVQVYAKDPVSLDGMVLVPPSRQIAARMAAGRHVVVEALRASELHSFLGHDPCLQIPAEYWFGQSQTDYGQTFAGADFIIGASDLKGRKPFLSGPEFDSWLTKGRARLNELCSPPKAPAQRTRNQTLRQKGLEEFSKVFHRVEGYRRLAGDKLHAEYERWCVKHKPEYTPYKRAEWYRRWPEVRDSSGASSVNYNRKDR